MDDINKIPRKNSEIIEGWKIYYDEVAHSVWKVSVEDKLKRRFEVSSLDLLDGIEQCKNYALEIEKTITEKIASYNPWDFSTNSPQTYSYDKTHRIIYHDLREIAQGSPLKGKAFLLNDLDVTKLIDETAGGLPIWNKTKNVVAIPLWTKNWLKGTLQRIAVVNATTNHASVFKRQFSVIQFEDFSENIITFIDDPLNKNKKISFDILAEAVLENRTLK
jgi:hypothetical protein